MLIDQYKLVKENVKAACEKAGRDPKEVTVIAVSKTKPLSMIEELMDCGVMDFGENKVQEIMKKYAVSYTHLKRLCVCRSGRE